MALVEFYYEGRNITIQCNKYDSIGKIFQQFSSQAGVNPNSVFFLYDGKIISNKNLNLEQIANTFDKKRNKLNILVCNSLLNTYSQFIFVRCIGADDAMKDYAKRIILLAIKEHPDNHLEKCKLILSKFYERYGGCWNCTFMKDDAGAGWFNVGRFFIHVKYGDYKIMIFTSPEYIYK